MQGLLVKYLKLNEFKFDSVNNKEHFTKLVDYILIVITFSEFLLSIFNRFKFL